MSDPKLSIFDATTDSAGNITLTLRIEAQPDTTLTLQSEEEFVSVKKTDLLAWSSALKALLDEMAG